MNLTHSIFKNGYELTGTEKKKIFAPINRKSDQLIEFFLISYYIMGFLFAMVYNTYLIALTVGGICLINYYAAKFLLPDKGWHRIIASVSLGIFMAQFIFQMHGMFEMHFFAFIGATILITYQDWKLQLPLTAVVVLHHGTFAYLQYIGIEEVYFTQLEYMDLFTFVVHSLLFVAVTAISGLWAYKLSQRTIRDHLIQSELEENKEELSAKVEMIDRNNRELEKSIKSNQQSMNYGSRIQEAFLPDLEDMRSAFKDFCLCFIPQNTVSGDFYWYKQTQEYTLLAAVDCTGHGVPGAFMSLIGNNILNEITTFKGITDPAHILEELHLGVRRALKQDSTNNRDGMDLSLVCIDEKEQTIYFAGAHNNLIQLTKAGEIIDYSGDNIGIGTKIKNKYFKTKTIRYDKDDFFFIYSDGYRDQFGGAKFRKYMHKPFKRLLQRKAEMSSCEFENLLYQEFNQWKGHNKQTDDVLVIGFQPK
ncbi:MAG: SpoIIE family protein phosphatase [Cyclobacteriaceae bacterium]|nr:SpoIIE family protein phosphatase [Cyclobacteriaceae bacterium]MCH8516649.1 SpoIIE family protein phosphatase [Cyclobacteriaceae bacterium]